MPSLQPKAKNTLHSRGKTAWLLGLAGLLPFWLSLAVAFWGPMVWQVSAVYGFLYYGAVILSFLGGVHWGAVIQRADHQRHSGDIRRLLMAMVPSLIAWPALMLSPVTGVWVVMIGFVLVWAYDVSREGRLGWPGWYLLLRSVLTVAVVLAHIGMIIRLGSRAWG
ncbi:DUF3429 domain-containing protein [Halomonas llamarensis]|uniref:DUF3429 domain-containing protein n=1 Tax=Halomonas llamarensis TaxID=2945104 RepID=A0ABT0SQ22_9GAMM|nr:DUF3429 domain-containing protein [Halomonas llamarensis]MCL7929555.1 DUF3429 domain-containing protein [Halomonas llamarensis]